MSEFVEREINHNVSSLVGLFQHQNTDEMYDKYIELVCHFDAEGEPLQILQYWNVSEWLAYQLKEREEAVTMNFYGMPIWGRTTCGQSIKMDSVIRDIYREHHG
ncbi:hypothetical protein [Aquimarina aggregata]|uniref:hypothetical protein n=1 Tax=Aquimarina aggregata TaxID=1642818 RepID=UPI002493619B|nr:hypothetical protein [Aquimarina aggregata]